MKVHKSITAKRVLAAVESSYSSLSSPGFCAACGDEADGVEPDARKYKCHSCGEFAVYGAEEFLYFV